MAFKVQNMSIDLMNHQATVWALDQFDPAKPAKTVTIQFPFTPPPSEASEQGKVLAAAKAVLQQALNEI
jgi:hypothetical protein